MNCKYNEIEAAASTDITIRFFFSKKFKLNNNKSNIIFFSHLLARIIGTNNVDTNPTTAETALNEAMITSSTF